MADEAEHPVLSPGSGGYFLLGTIKMNAPLVLNPPVRGQWAILNPPGHAKLAYDFLAVDDRRSPYNGVSLLRHIVTTLPVDITFAWNQPVVAVADGIVVAASDGAPDRERICMTKDLIRLT